MRPEIDGYSLAGEDVEAYAGGEFIVVVRVFFRFLYPEVIGEHGVHVQARHEGFQPPFAAEREFPGRVVLFQGEGYFCLVGRKTRYEAEHDFRFPLLFSPVIPTDAEGEESHGSGILYVLVFRDQTVPPGAVLLQFTLVAFCPSLRPVVLRHSRHDGCHTHEEGHDADPNNRPLHTRILPELK